MLRTPLEFVASTDEAGTVTREPIMKREFHQALMLYLDHCQENGLFVVHPLLEWSEILDGDWHMGDEKGLIAIVTRRGNVGCVCTQRAMSLGC